MKHRNRKPRRERTNYRKISIMAVLFGALLIGGSITAFSNMGSNNTTQSSPEDVQEIISFLNSPAVPGANALGSENATISVIEFGDYQCPFCARFNQETKDTLVSQYVDTGIINYGFKDFVINDLPRDRLSSMAAEASYCAAEQDKYWEYHDEVYSNHQGENTGWINRESLINFAQNVGVNDINQFGACMDSHKYRDQVIKNHGFAVGVGLTSTPTFLIIGQNSTKIAAIEGAQPIQVFDDVINQFLNNTI